MVGALADHNHGVCVVSSEACLRIGDLTFRYRVTTTRVRATESRRGGGSSERVCVARVVRRARGGDADAQRGCAVCA